MITDESGQSAGFETAPLTLEDVSKRIDKICDDYLAALVTAKTGYETKIDELGASIDAAPHLDQDTVGAIVLGRVNKMMRTAGEMGAPQ